MTCRMMMSLGVYVLGATDVEERKRLEAHLRGCPACRAELARLEPLPSLLAGVPDELLDRRRQPSVGTPPARVRRPGMARPPLRAAAALCLAAIAGLGGGLWLAPTVAGTAPATITLSAANAATNVSATAALTATSWGTGIQLQLRGIPLNVECRLIVRSRNGATEVAGAWDAWQEGPIAVPASTAWLPSDIASLQVATADRTLVTIRTGQRPAPRGRSR